MPFTMPPNLSNGEQHTILHGCAGKSLSQPTSRYHRTELIVSLERGVCSCAELQVFSCSFFLPASVQRLKGSMSGDVCYFNNTEILAVIKFFFLQGKAPKEIHTILIEILWEHAPSYATVKN